MTDKIAELRQSVLSRLEDPKESEDHSDDSLPEGVIDTAQSAVELLGDDLPAAYPTTLDWLCRKIQVAGSLRNFYQPDWKKHPDSSLLDEAGWHGVLVALLVCAERMGQGSTEEELGRALKCINALMIGIEIAKTKLGTAPDVVVIADDDIGDIGDIEQEAIRLLGVLTRRSGAEESGG